MGKTPAKGFRQVLDAVHPHMRGENPTPLPAKVVGLGTPPHAWGKPRKYVRYGRNLRYTPTCVGKTRPAYAVRFHNQVHPHMRGENEFRALMAAAGVRYTPTCVGKTLIIAASTLKRKVHPHMRGENVPPPYSQAIKAGTPPHAWGKQGVRRYRAGCSRYTPTCVGKTSSTP